MGRRHIDGARAAAVERADVERAAGERDRRDPGAARRQDAAHPGIPRVLHREQPVPAHKRQDVGDQHLRARADDERLRRGRDAPQPLHEPGERQPEPGAAPRVPRQQQVRAAPPQHPAHQVRPRGVGEVFRVRRARAEVPADLRRLFRVRLRRGPRGHVKPAPGPALAQAFLQEAPVGRLHGGGGDPQVGGQRPLGGQLLPVCKPSRPDLPAQCFVQLLAQRLARVRPQRAGEHGPPSRSPPPRRSPLCARAPARRPPGAAARGRTCGRRARPPPSPAGASG